MIPKFSEKAKANAVQKGHSLLKFSISGKFVGGKYEASMSLDEEKTKEFMALATKLMKKEITENPKQQLAAG